jgi:hypothetical protein
MSRSIPVIRPLVAAALIVALAAPAAFAAPIDIHSPGHPSQGQPSQGQTYKDLRSPDAQDAATRKASKHDPVYWSYGYQAMDPKDAAALAQERAYSSFVKAKPAPAPATQDDDTPWAIIGLGITAGVLALLAGAAMVVKTRVRRAQRVAA